MVGLLDVHASVAKKQSTSSWEGEKNRVVTVEVVEYEDEHCGWSCKGSENCWVEVESNTHLEEGEAEIHKSIWDGEEFNNSWRLFFFLKKSLEHMGPFLQKWEWPNKSSSVSLLVTLLAEPLTQLPTGQMPHENCVTKTCNTVTVGCHYLTSARLASVKG